jgi:ADP-heptose:LPS heptosyltransferase
MKRILILRTDRLGDMILTLPMVSVIKKYLADARVIFGIREYTKPIVEACPDVDEIVTIDAELSASEIAKVLREVKADVIIVPSPKFKLVLASFLSRIPIRIGTGYRWYSFLFTHKVFEHRKTAEHNEAEYNIRMLEKLGIPIAAYPLPNLVIESEETAKKYAVLHMFTGGSANEWSSEKFKESALNLANTHSLEIHLTGESKHREFLFTVVRELKLLGVSAHIHTELTLIELAKLLEGASLVVAGSTGPGHLAAALGTRTIGLFQLVTPLSKERWGFRGKRVLNIEPATKPKVECPACKECVCMDRITTEQVTQAAQHLLTTYED